MKTRVFSLALLLTCSATKYTMAGELSDALKEARRGVAKQLLVNGYLEADEIDEETGRTPLILAILHGYKNIVPMLLNSKNVDVNKQDKAGLTALHCAATGASRANKKTKIIRKLLTVPGIDTQKKNKKGQTALCLATLATCPEAVAALCGLDVEKEVKLPEILGMNRRLARHGLAPERTPSPEDRDLTKLSSENLEEFLFKDDLLSSYNLETLVEAQKLNEDGITKCGDNKRSLKTRLQNIKIILDAAIAYKIVLEDKIRQHAAQRSLAFLEGILPTKQHVIIFGDDEVKIKIPRDSFLELLLKQDEGE